MSNSNTFQKAIGMNEKDRESPVQFEDQIKPPVRKAPLSYDREHFSNTDFLSIAPVQTMH